MIKQFVSLNVHRRILTIRWRWENCCGGENKQSKTTNSEQCFLTFCCPIGEAGNGNSSWWLQHYCRGENKRSKTMNSKQSFLTSCCNTRSESCCRAEVRTNEVKLWIVNKIFLHPVASLVPGRRAAVQVRTNEVKLWTVNNVFLHPAALLVPGGWSIAAKVITNKVKLWTVSNVFLHSIAPLMVAAPL